MQIWFHTNVREFLSAEVKEKGKSSVVILGIIFQLQKPKGLKFYYLCRDWREIELRPSHKIEILEVYIYAERAVFKSSTSLGKLQASLLIWVWDPGGWKSLPWKCITTGMPHLDLEFRFIYYHLSSESPRWETALKQT